MRSSEREGGQVQGQGRMRSNEREGAQVQEQGKMRSNEREGARVQEQGGNVSRSDRFSKLSPEQRAAQSASELP